MGDQVTEKNNAGFLRQSTELEPELIVAVWIELELGALARVNWPLGKS